MKYCLLIVALLAGCAQQQPVTRLTDLQMEMPLATTAPLPAYAPIVPVAAVPMPPPPVAVTASTDIHPPVEKAVRKQPRELILEATASGHERNLPERIDDFADQLRKAKATLDIPATTNVRTPVRVKLTIDTATGLIGEVRPPMRPGTTQVVLQISKVLEAKLVAPEFSTIVALAPDRQAVSFTEPTIWEWELSGAKPGKHDIYLSINAIVTVDNDRTERSIKTFEQAVSVEITPMQWVGELVKQHLEWIWTTLLLPAGLWLWKRFKKGDEK